MECTLGITLTQAIAAVTVVGGGLVACIGVLWRRCAQVTQEALDTERRARERAQEIQAALLTSSVATKRSEHGSNGT